MKQIPSLPALASDIPTLYRIDIVKNGQRWTDTVGVRATAETIAETAVAYVSEAAIECRPEPGDCCSAEVFDDHDRFLLRAKLEISDKISEDPPTSRLPCEG